MNIRDKQHVAICEACGVCRDISYASIMGIKIRKRNNHCKSCSGKLKPQTTVFKKGQTPWNAGKVGVQEGYWKGKKRPDLSEGARTRALKGGKAGNCSNCNEDIWLTPTRQKLTYTTCSRTCYSELYRRLGLRKGENSPTWKGGITPESLRIRHSYEYKQWRTSVFERDDYTCRFCGVRGGRLNADHIKRFSEYPELRLELTNGRTLCEPCHWGVTRLQLKKGA